MVLLPSIQSPKSETFPLLPISSDWFMTISSTKSVHLKSQDPQTVVPGPMASASSENLLEMKIIGPYLILTEAKTQE